MIRETITLTQKEQHRAHVLARVQHGVLPATEAAVLLGLSLRPLRRLLARLRQQGLAGLAHGNRGRPSARRLAETIRARVLTLARTTYAGANDHHLTDLLREREGLRLSRPTVQRLLRAEALGTPRPRRPPRHRRRRARMPQAGLLIQMDGSHHPWLEDRGPRLVLHAPLDGTLAIYYRGQRLSAQKLPPSHRPPGRPQERSGESTPCPDTPLRE